MARKLKPIEDMKKWSKNLSTLKIGEMAKRNREGYDPKEAIDIIIKRSGRNSIEESLIHVLKAYPEARKYLENKLNKEIKFSETHFFAKDTDSILFNVLLSNYGIKSVINIVNRMKIEAPGLYNKILYRLKPIEYAKKITKEIKDKSTKLPNKKLKLENTLQKMVKEING